MTPDRLQQPPDETNGLAAPAPAAAEAPPAAPGPPRLLWTLAEAAHALNLSARTLKRAAAEGGLPSGAVVRPFGRRRLFSRAVLEDWIRAGCPAPAWRPQRG
jgi:excisionase family DNA binding protein